MTALVPSEAELQSALIEAAMLRGYLAHHVRPARTARGYRTPLEGHPGFPDLVLIDRGAGALFVWELKSATGRLDAMQAEWLAAWSAALPDVLRVDVRVVTPDMLDDALLALELRRWPTPDDDRSRP